MLRCTVLRAVVGVLAVVLLVAVPNLALGQQSVSEEVGISVLPIHVHHNDTGWR
jgi:competence protein ComGC